MTLRRPQRRTGVSGVGLAVQVLLGLLLGAQAGFAQWRPAQAGDPVQAEARQDGGWIRIDIAIDEGWYIYGVGAEQIGLPLQVFGPEGGRRLEVIPVEPPEITTIEGRPVPVHRGRSSFLADLRSGEMSGAAIGEAIGEVRVRWAACRGDLCIPRESRVRVEQGWLRFGTEPASLSKATAEPCPALPSRTSPCGPPNASRSRLSATAGSGRRGGFATWCERTRSRPTT